MATLTHLRRLEAGYWERDWRNTHRESAVYPENHLWDAVHGYLDLLTAGRRFPATSAEPAVLAVA